jgi:predicted transcriptional regulator
MGLTKSEIFTFEQNVLATQARVLAHPARIAIIQELIKMDSCVCGDLVTEIGLAQATIPQHLKELKSIGLIQGTIDGTSVCYCINAEKWEEIKNKFAAFFALPADKKTNCCT